MALRHALPVDEMRVLVIATALSASLTPAFADVRQNPQSVPTFVGANQAGDVRLEYGVKAAYLLNFARFVEWPADPADTGPLTICVAGTNPFGDVLDETLRGELVNGRSVRARPARQGERCHVLFVPVDVPPDAYIKSLRTQPVLTVGERADFLRHGGMVNFVIEAGRVRFEIDADAAERVKLKISSRLLRLARTTESTKSATGGSR
jgi:hypothetical protein